MKNFTYTRHINYYETEQMGIVHHSNYRLQDWIASFQEEAQS